MHGHSAKRAARVSGRVRGLRFNNNMEKGFKDLWFKDLRFTELGFNHAFAFHLYANTPPTQSQHISNIYISPRGGNIEAFV